MKKLLFLVLVLIPSIAHAEGYFYHYDHLGGVDGITNWDGEIVVDYDYYPFGDTAEEEVYDDIFLNSYQYTGQESDDEIDLYYYDARYYDAMSGRFMSQDPAVYDERVFEMLGNPQMFNSYTYVLNNPVKYVDPSGEIIAIPGRVQKPIWNALSYIFCTNKGLEYSGDWLRRSLEYNPGDLSFGPDDAITAAVQSSDHYQNTIMGEISTRIGYGKMDGFFGETFPEGDLETSIGGCTIYYSATANDDGGYDVNITLTDTYDFDWKVEAYEDNFKATIANNLAVISESLGAINNYDISISMKDTVDVQQKSK